MWLINTVYHFLEKSKKGEGRGGEGAYELSIPEKGRLFERGGLIENVQYYKRIQ